MGFNGYAEGRGAGKTTLPPVLHSAHCTPCTVCASVMAAEVIKTVGAAHTRPQVQRAAENQNLLRLIALILGFSALALRL